MNELSFVKSLYRGYSLGTTLYVYARFWIYKRYPKIESLIPKNGTIVDLGSGIGIFTNYLAVTGPKRRIIGFERNRGSVSRARWACGRGNIPNVRYIVADVTKVRLPKADVVCIMHVLHHLRSIEAQEALLHKCVRTLRTGGTLFIDEIEKKLSIRYMLAYLVDSLLCPGETFYYRTKLDMVELLTRLGLSVSIQDASGPFTPYPTLVYLCKKL